MLTGIVTGGGAVIGGGITGVWIGPRAGFVVAVARWIRAMVDVTPRVFAATSVVTEMAAEVVGVVVIDELGSVVDGWALCAAVCADRLDAHADPLMSTSTAATPKESLKFEVTLSDSASSAFSVNYAITPGSATYSQKVTGGGDYGGRTSGTLNFKMGAKSATISIPIWPDQNPDTNETFTVTLSGPTATGVTVIDGTGTATLLTLT
jgi:hypothetical protein